MLHAITERPSLARTSRKLLLMRKQAISWMMYDEDMKKKMLLKKKQEQAKVKKISSWEYKKALAVAG